MGVQKPLIEMNITCIVKTVVNVSSQGTRGHLDNYRLDIDRPPQSAQSTRFSYRHIFGLSGTIAKIGV